MKRKAVVCNNLIGDSLYLLKPLDVYLSKFGEECAGFLVLPNIGGDIIRAHFTGRIPIYNSVEEINEEVDLLYMDAGRSLQLCLEHHEKYKEFQHISQGYAFMLGVNIDEDFTPPLEWIPPAPERTGPLKVLIGPFSKSCARHTGEEPNKTMDDWKWEYLIRYFRKHDWIVQCACGPGEYLRFASLPLSSYRTGNTIKEMLEIYQQADLVVSVDSGTGHIAAACNIPSILLRSTFKLAPPPFIAPLWAKNTTYLMIGKPAEVVPASILFGIKNFLDDRLKDAIRKV